MRATFAFFAIAAVTIASALPYLHAEEWESVQPEQIGDWTLYSRGFNDEAEATTAQGRFRYFISSSGECQFHITLTRPCPNHIVNFAVMTRGSNTSFVSAACFRDTYAATIPSWHVREKCSTWGPEAFSDVSAVQIAFAREDGSFDIADVPLNGLSTTVKALHDTMRQRMARKNKGAVHETGNGDKLP